jgi:hypothetical protein
MARDEAASLRQTVAHVRRLARQAVYVNWRTGGEERTTSDFEQRWALREIDRTCERAQERWRGVNHQETDPLEREG